MTKQAEKTRPTVNAVWYKLSTGKPVDLCADGEAYTDEEKAVAREHATMFLNEFQKRTDYCKRVFSARPKVENDQSAVVNYLNDQKFTGVLISMWLGEDWTDKMWATLKPEMK